MMILIVMIVCISLMKKIFKALAAHFAQYGHRATENLGL